ncbi:hypothetical protein H0H93_015125 [Arthromyces matolae]|nr:hypothetical protein H0H93_015125 [Arthromyces matolae]
MFGIVSACNLFSPVVAGTLASFRQKRITIAPFAQEEILDISRVCSVLHLPTECYATYSAMGISFTTRGEGKGSTRTYAKPNSSASDVFSVSASPSKKPAPTSHAGPVGALNFEDLVPIFDGRDGSATDLSQRPFRFTAEDFSELSAHSWRTYAKNKSEVPEKSVVCVGYTAGSFTGASGYESAASPLSPPHASNSFARYLSLNVKFVIVLHTPKVKLARVAKPKSPGTGRKPAPRQPAGSGSAKGKSKAVTA